jgi:four helix bundle protein
MESIYKNKIYFKEEGFEALKAYQKAFQLAMDIYEVSKSFPKEEKYSLTDQVRRSSRSVCANIAEAYRKRVYPKSFCSKINDADGESSDTLVHLKFAKYTEYITEEVQNYFESGYDEVGKILNYMFKNPDKFSGIDHSIVSENYNDDLEFN